MSKLRQTNNENQEKRNNKFVFPIILASLFLIGIFWWQKGCNSNQQVKDKEDTAILDSAGASIDEAVKNAQLNMDSSAQHAIAEAGRGIVDSNGNWMPTKGEPKTIKLENGKTIETFSNAFEDQLYLFIKEPSAVPDKNLWFNFDNLFFENGKTKLLKGYETQLENTCEILKAYPTTKIKIGGYTDNTGDSLANIKLSTERAKKIYEMMLQKEVEKSSFDEKPYEGYGSQHPLEENNTPEGRAQNRRIAISVRAK